MLDRLPVDKQALQQFCKRWKITELGLFGSVLRDDFHQDSDIDVLVTFAPDAHWTLMDHVVIQDELSHLLGRKVDLVSRRGIEQSRNYLRRKEILDSAKVIYAA
jgi:predicted nucleotidyltransferase